MRIMKEAWDGLDEMVKGRFRYLYTPLPSEFNLDEWIGEQGMCESTYRFLESYMKQAFIAGHKYGALAAMGQMGKDDFELDESLDRQYAADTWEKLQGE